KPLAKQIKSNPNAPACQNCGHKNHITANCKWLGQPKCFKCGWFGHIASKCWWAGKRKAKDDGNDQKPKKEKKKEKTNEAEEETQNAKEASSVRITEITFSGKEEMEEDSTSHYFDTYDENTLNLKNSELYDWLADSATTSHITNVRNAFTTYNPINNMT